MTSENQTPTTQESVTILETAPDTPLKPGLRKFLIPLFILVLLVVSYSVLAKNYSWWPYKAGSDATSSWKVYENSQYGFSFKYPYPQYVIQEETKDHIEWGPDGFEVDFFPDGATQPWQQKPTKTFHIEGREIAFYQYSLWGGQSYIYKVVNHNDIIAFIFTGNEEHTEIINSLHFTK